MSMSENTLEKNVDNEIKVMASDVCEEVSMENERQVTMVHTPFDPNLVCPICGKEHRIGEIQKFRAHVDACGNEGGDEEMGGGDGNEGNKNEETRGTLI